jgi:hypothetical protein
MQARDASAADVTPLALLAAMETELPDLLKEGADLRARAIVTQAKIRCAQDLMFEVSKTSPAFSGEIHKVIERFSEDLKQVVIVPTDGASVAFARGGLLGRIRAMIDAASEKEIAA